MSDEAALDRLAKLAGVEGAYRDYFERETLVPPETKRAALRAMGIAADDEQQVAASLQRLDEAPWRRPLEPVIVALRGTAPRVAITMPANTQGFLHWRLVEEHGATRSGDVRFDALPLSGSRQLDGMEYQRRVLELRGNLPLGYHRLVVGAAGEATLIVAPSRCYLPPAMERGAKVWGLAIQLYSLRSHRNWGMGDFTDLRAFATTAKNVGAAAVGLNPLHELDPLYPDAASPYGPSSRLHLNTAYLDVTAIADFEESDEAQRMVADPAFSRKLTELRATELVDYAGVAACKRPVLEVLFDSFRRCHLDGGTERARTFRSFVDAGGVELERLTIFEALRERYRFEAPPAELHDARSPAVRRFAEEHRDRVAFYAYLQWNADEQLGAAARTCDGMTVGLYRDLAVGAQPWSAEAWSDPDVLVQGIAIGAPADALNVLGQNWGLAPLSPVALRARAYAPFARLIAANMRHAGALRIDHVMSLQRLFWIPAGAPATAGAYVRYPFADLLAVVALESERHGCLVIGEDLGTVPDGFRERLQWARILSYRLLYFERDRDGGFTAPEAYPPLALASPGTHDLPTLPAYWRGADVVLRSELGLLPRDTSLLGALSARKHELSHLLQALVEHGDVDHPTALRWLEDGASPSDDAWRLIIAAYRYLARGRARLLIAPIEDVLGIVEQINVPGTVAEHPNWRRKLTIAVEDLPSDGRLAAFASALYDVRALPAPPAVPTSTYRLQFHGGFRFDDARHLVPYLHALGITHVYASPFFAARAGSTHGYDVTDHGKLNPEVGTRAELEALVAELHRHEMGLIADFVPNHVGVGADNPWWQDVLEWGRASPYATFFDIDWRPGKWNGKLLLPFLGAPYGTVLERGDLALTFDAAAGTFAFAYHDHRFPLNPESYAPVLDVAEEVATHAEGDVQRTLHDLARLFTRRWATRSAADRSAAREAFGDAKRALATAAHDDALRSALVEATRRFNASSADGGLARLQKLVAAQHYRLAFWRVAVDEINYRRFFDVNDLAGLRVELVECFGYVHRLLFDLIDDGSVQGMRIDHIDGLFDPKAYLTLLRERSVAMDQPLYLIVEKILARHERLRDDWPIAGTTGYEFLNALNALFVASANEERFDLAYRAFTGEAASFDDVLLASKRRIIDVHLASELEVLATELDRLAQADLRSSDFTRTGLRNALADVVAAFPVYRTYVDGDGASPEDRRYIQWAVAQARRRSASLDPDVFDFLLSVLTADAVGTYRARDVLHFAMKFQQYTGPVMAKAYEDTAFYRYARLVSLNEVGGDPRRFGASVGAFHRAMRDRAQRTPYALSATATHDTKRGEDTRLRIDALSELPAVWRRTVLRLERVNRRHKRMVDDAPAPDRIDEWMLYQTLVGVWPLESLANARAPLMPPDDIERIAAYMQKATREAKRHTSWSNPNAAYEDATLGFVRTVLSGRRDDPFWSEFGGIVEASARIAMVHSLAQTVVKATAPGASDVYAGTELWDFSLVDPDNRRPIDWERRRAFLSSLPAPGAESAESARGLLNSWHDGRVKLYVVRTLLQLRRARREMFLNEPYLPLDTAGAHADRVLAYDRGGTLVVVPRLVGRFPTIPLGDVWRDTTVVAGERRAAAYREAFTARRVTVPRDGALSVADALHDFPVAVLVPEAEA